MTQLDLSNNSTTVQTEVLPSQLHDLRDCLNTVLTSAMVLERAEAVSPEHQKYLAWILEKTAEADSLVDLIAQEAKCTSR